MRRLSTFLAAAGVAALVLVGAAPAVAAGSAIDPGDSLYSINCDNAYNDWQLMSVDPTTAFSTTIGEGTGSASELYAACAGQPAYDASTGKAYFIQWNTFVDPGEAHLASIDLTTGDSTEIGQFFTVDGEFPLTIFVGSIAIGLDGSAYAFTQGFLWSLDLSTGELTPINESLSNTYSFAVDPTTGIFYAINTDNERFSVNVTDGTYVFLDVVELPAGDAVFSLQIDGAGRFWIMSDDSSISGASLWSFAPGDAATPTVSGPFIDGPYYTEAILIVPGKVLAATGVDSSAVPLIAGGAVMLALLGVGGLVVARRRRAA